MTAIAIAQEGELLARLGAPAVALAELATGGWRAEAARRFAATGLPTRRRESWKYTDLSALREFVFHPAEGVSLSVAGAEALPAPLCGAQRSPHRFVFVNGHLDRARSTPDPLPGADFTSGGRPLTLEAWEDAGAEPSPMVLLNTALSTEGLQLRIGDGVILERPIEVLFFGAALPGPTAWHPRHRIELAANSAATLIEVHAAAGDVAYLANHVSTIIVGENARLRHVVLQEEGPAGYHVGSRFVSVAAEGRYEAFALTLGGRLIRNEIVVSLDGRNAHCGIAGAYLLRGRQHCDNTTVIGHGAPRTTCREVFKGVLDGASRGVFQGRIVVHPGAQQADGHQLSKVLLLSDEAETDQKPELEIYADDVKCAHGAAAGQLDRDELFYLRSRGIAEEAARRLLIEGFLAEVFEELGDDELRAAFASRARAWLATAQEARP